MSDLTEVTKTDIEAYAAARGRVVVYPERNELFIDIDSDAALAMFHSQYELFNESIALGCCRYELKPSPSGKPGRYHAIVTLAWNVDSNKERIALQAMLGSDLKHELLSHLAAIRGSECPTVFFELPPQPSGDK